MLVLAPQAAALHLNHARSARAQLTSDLLSSRPSEPPLLGLRHSETLLRHSESPRTMAAKLFVLDEPLLPGQVLRCREPPSLPGAASLVWDLIAATSEPLIAVGCSESALLPRGVHVTAGWDNADFILSATSRVADIVESGVGGEASACLDGGGSGIP